MNSVIIKTKNNHHISVVEFIAPKKPKAAVIIASATGVKQTLYLKFSEFLRQQNFTVYTFDYAGIGASKHQSLKKFNTSASSWATNDLEAVISHVKQNNKDTKLIILGHSIGGQLIGLAPSSKFADGILLVAAQTGYWKFWKGFSRLKMYLTWHLLIPVLTPLVGYFPGKRLGASEDLPKDMALEWKKWCCSKNYLFDHIPEAKQKYETITCPIKSFSAEDDNYAPKATVDWLTNKYSNASIERKHLTPKSLKLKNIGHFGFFRSKNKVPIWNQFLEEIIELSNPKTIAK